MKDAKVLDKLPAAYRALLESWTSYRKGKAITFFDTGDDLKTRVLDAVEAYCASALVFWGQRARSRNKTAEDSTWELMTFTERHSIMMEAFQGHAHGEEGLKLPAGLSVQALKTSEDGYELVLAGRKKTIPVILTACPDRFSYAEAAKYVGYPFRSEVETWDKPLGPLHVVLVYRTITDTQIRRHLGNPDIHVSKEDWGFFAADPERFIQVAYLSRCTDSHEVMQRSRDFMAWLDEYDQVTELVRRSKVRSQILKARGG